MKNIPIDDPDFGRFVEANQEALDRENEILHSDLTYQLLRKRADDIWREIETKFADTTTR